MAFLFYILAWLAILGGAAWGGYLGVNAFNAAAKPVDYVDFAVNTLPLTVAPSGGLLLSGLILLAVAGLLSRLDEIAYNTRPMN